METKVLENDTYVAYKEDSNPSYQWIVYIKAPMNNLPGCQLYFKQEVYRSWYRTKKFKSYFRSQKNDR